MIEKRFEELNERAYERGYNTFSDFLNMEEQSVLKSTFIPCVLFGGYSMAERVVAGFGEDLNDEKFPIVCVCAKPLIQKFADELTHRDFLGALMNLGIKRELVGDIIVDDNCGYILCLEHIADYICENLNRVRHTSVKTQISALPENLNKEIESSEVFAASKRIDVVISAVYNLSRNETSKLVKNERVFVNSRMVSSVSSLLNGGDVVSVRGFGRFVFVKEIKETKKGRLVLEVKKY